MPRIETIKASDAPTPPKKMSEAAREMLNAITSLKKDEVLRVQPDPDKTIRGLKTSIGRIASNNNLKIETWTDAEEPYLLRAQELIAVFPELEAHSVDLRCTHSSPHGYRTTHRIHPQNPQKSRTPVSCDEF